MKKRKLNKPASWKKQINPNTQRMKALMRDIRNDTERLTRNSKDLEEWTEKLAPYTASNCFVIGAHADTVREIINSIVGVVDQTSLPSGANAELVKGTMAEACMTMVTNVGEDIKTELQKIAVESYNNRLAPAETAKLIGEKIDSLSKTRCQAIARTETCRAANIANYLNAQKMGAKSYSVICNEGACDYCIDEYGENQDTVYSIDDTDNLPPLHPNCRCTPVWSMKEP
jgi:SPP1 gp7 family putative phage head morphogenesis protein